MPDRPATAPVRRLSVLGQARSRRTREELVATAIRLWKTQEFDDLTVDAIVEAAGVSKGTFYYHFRRKEDLLLELGWTTVDRVGDEAETAYAGGASLDEALDVGMAGLSRRVTRMPRGTAARTIQEFAFTRPDATSPVSGRHSFMSGLLHAAQERGELAASVDTDEVADVMNHVLIRTILEAVRGNTPEPLVETLRRRTRLILHGLQGAYPATGKHPRRPNDGAQS